MKDGGRNINTRFYEFQEGRKNKHTERAQVTNFSELKSAKEER